MTLARLAALDDERDLGAGFLAHQAIVDGGHGEQAGDGRIGRIDAAIGENRARCSRIDRVRGASAEVVKGVLKAGLAIGGAEQCRQRGGQSATVWLVRSRLPLDSQRVPG